MATTMIDVVKSKGLESDLHRVRTSHSYVVMFSQQHFNSTYPCWTDSSFFCMKAFSNLRDAKEISNSALDKASMAMNRV
jgi:hypothetical protein